MMDPPGLAGDPNRDLYSILLVSRHASPDEIKKAYRKLALKYHPDKNPDEGDAFRDIAQAYSTLSNPSKRSFYDRYGQQGIQFYESLTTHGLPTWMLTPAVHCSMITAIFLFAMSILVCLPTFVLKRIDGSLTWPWAAVLTPLWVVNLIGCFIILAPALLQHERSCHQLRDLMSCLSSISWHSFACLALLITSELLLTAKLDSEVESPPGSYDYTIALSPIMLLLAPAAFESFKLYFFASYQWFLHVANGTSSPFPDSRHTLGMNAAFRCLPVVGLLLLGLKLDGHLDESWWFVLLPEWLVVFLIAIRLHRVWQDVGAAEVASNYSLLLTDPLLHCPAHTPDEERTARRAVVAIGLFVTAIFGACLLLLSLLLNGQAQYSAEVVVAPLFGFLILCCVCSCTVAGCARLGAAAAGVLINMNEGVAPERRGGDPLGVTRQSAGATPQSLGVPQSRVAATVDASSPVSIDGDGQSTPDIELGCAANQSGGSPHGCVNGSVGTKSEPLLPSVLSSCLSSEPPPADVVTFGQSLTVTSEASLQNMSSRQLKAELEQRGVAHTHILEKAELIALLKSLDARPGRPVRKTLR
ncbi:MAG: hypothetical protein SGPRY_003313 [Prymnesium sp.]